MSLPQSRQPAGIPTGGQFAASAHAESGVSLAPASKTPVADAIAAAVADCPDCGTPMAGHLGGGKFVPGSQCEVEGCGHTAADMVVESDPTTDEDGRSFEYRLEPDGTIRVTDEDGDTTMLSRIDDEDWDGINPFRGVTQAAVRAGLDARNAHDLTEPACIEAGYGLMSGTYDVLLDRETIPTGYLLAHQMRPADIARHFDQHVSFRHDRLCSDYSGWDLDEEDEADETAMDHVRATCQEAGLMAMWPFYESMSDRGCLPQAEALEFDADQVVNDYESRIAPGIDEMEDVIRADFRDRAADRAADPLDDLDEYLETIGEQHTGKPLAAYRAATEAAWDRFDDSSRNDAALRAYADDLDAAAQHFERIAEDMGYNSDVGYDEPGSAVEGRDANFDRRFDTARTRLATVTQRLRQAADAVA